MVKRTYDFSFRKKIIHKKYKNMDANILKLFSLKDKVAIVTGAAKGNGRAIAEGFLRAGAAVYFIDILGKELKKTVDQREILMQNI